MDYLIIKNGLLVTGNKVFKADILIGNSKIIEISKTVNRPIPGTPVIDAAGRFVLPSGIDTTPYFTLNDIIEEEEINKMLSAEILSGTTTISEQFKLQKFTELANSKTDNNFIDVKNLTDYAIHLNAEEFNQTNYKTSLNHYLNKGIASYSISGTFLLTQSEDFKRDLFDFLSSTNQTLIINLNMPEPLGSGYLTNGHNQELSHNDPLQNLTQILWMVKDVTFPILLSKLKFEQEIEILTPFINENKKIHAELHLPCLLGDKSDFEMVEQNLWQSQSKSMTPINSTRFIDLLLHENYLPARPSLGLTIGNTKDSPVFNRPNSFSGIKYYSSMLYTLCVTNGNMAITDFVACFATRPAKLLGIYPQKGTLRVGSDADILIWNPDFDRNLYCNFAHKPDSQEHKLQGKADFVFSKGKMVFDGETFLRENLQGQYLYRMPYL